MIYILGGLVVGAAGLAIYERKKNRKLVFDDANDTSHDPERAAYTKAEAIRAEAQIAHPPHGGGIF